MRMHNVFRARLGIGWRGVLRRFTAGAILIVSLLGVATAEADRHVLVRDITTITGVRNNPLVGYGIVVGLKGTGDSSQTQFTTQTLANALRRMGVQLSPALALMVQTKNVAAVFVTATLPPFAQSGMSLDVTVSSVGDAKSLEGGMLLLTPLQGPDGQVYAAAQGAVTLGGYSFGAAANLKMVNHATVGIISEGAIVERDMAVDLSRLTTVSFLLRAPDFTAAKDIANAINQEFHNEVAVALDSRRIDVSVERSGVGSVPLLIARVQNLAITFRPPAKVVVNERTGTIVMGGDVKLSPVSVLHGNLSIDVTTTFAVSQPPPFSKTGETVVVPETTVQAKEGPARSIQLAEGASVEELISGLHAIGASARDIVAILQAIKAAGGLQADLEVL